MQLYAGILKVSVIASGGTLLRVAMGLAIALLCVVRTGDAFQSNGVSFEAASIRLASPDAQGEGIRAEGKRFIATNSPLRTVILFAFGIRDPQLLGGVPAWAETTRYDITATAGGSNTPLPATQSMVVHLLQERFGLTYHRQDKTVPSFNLMVGKRGPKMKTHEGVGAPSLYAKASGQYVGTAVTMSVLAQFLSRALKRPVTDKSGLDGAYDFDLRWEDGDDVGVSIYTALEEQLGLHIAPARTVATMIMVDNIRRPSNN